MIRPPGLLGAAFTEGSDGDVRTDLAARQRLASRQGLPELWATIRQVHGGDVVRVRKPGLAASADAAWTTEHDLAVAVFTADCYGVVVRAEEAVGVAHAGWRGLGHGVITRLREAMVSQGHQPLAAAVGPGIGPCCFEVGEEVVERFPGFETTTRWSTTSVDLPGAVIEQLDGLEVWLAGSCTMHEQGYFSHRENATTERMAALGWLP